MRVGADPPDVFVVHSEIVEEEFLKEVTGSKLVVCHFYHNDFARCKIMDEVGAFVQARSGHTVNDARVFVLQHLRKLAGKHFKTKFIKLNAEKAPFFVSKLAVRLFRSLARIGQGPAAGSCRMLLLAKFSMSDVVSGRMDLNRPLLEAVAPLFDF